MAGTKLPAETWLPYWYQALGKEIGIRIECTDRVLLVNALYAARKGANDPRLEALMIFQPKENLIFIAKKAVELDAI